MRRRSRGLSLSSHPILDSLMSSSIVFIDYGEYIGNASDGTQVTLGIIGGERALERYLEGNPTPDMW